MLDQVEATENDVAIAAVEKALRDLRAEVSRLLKLE